LQFGDGLFETILFFDGKLILEQEHLDRLYRDSSRLFINIDKEKLALELDLFKENIVLENLSQPGVVKIIITRESSGRGYAFSKQSGANRFLQYYSGISYPRENHEGVRIGLTDIRLPDDSATAGIKHLNRLQQVLASAKIRKSLYQEIVVCGSHTEILEGSFTNIFIIKGDMLLTPRLNRAGVRGVMRDYILDNICPLLMLQAKEAIICLDDLINANEIFVCNSICGIWPVTAIDVRHYDVGNVTLAIQKQADLLGYQNLYLKNI